MFKSVLFVCLGNICRSPLAEGAFRAEVAKRKLPIVTDSAGTAAYHIDEKPDPRAIATAKRNGVDISGLRGRQIKPADFTRFDHIVAMDTDNLANLKRIMPAEATAQLSLMLDWAGRAGESVQDPYYGDEDGFNVTWADVSAAAKGLADHLAQKPE
ncbi:MULTISPECIES: low molecular weight protein-tyrosine-phosphatase [unclassified Brevundimonas]|uniref:low molecular weight protein-tyrosine-phosphatase n=1 Tax=unclassified Brevundimonas TaxID=2622653 RepID=UPI0025C51A88|nr:MULTISPECIES: low molecular weight protein-tyrosine-phosphatase [unclassified Brevundimonas]